MDQFRLVWYLSLLCGANETFYIFINTPQLYIHTAKKYIHLTIVYTYTHTCKYINTDQQHILTYHTYKHTLAH